MSDAEPTVVYFDWLFVPSNPYSGPLLDLGN